MNAGKIVWVVGEDDVGVGVGVGDGATVDVVVARAGGDDRALAEGRVFIGLRRAATGDAVRVGDEVRITPAAVLAQVRILRFERGVLAVDKPAGIATIPDTHDASSSLLHRAARQVSLAPDTLHPTSRLDRQVSGVVLFTTTPAARERLQNARESGLYVRRYVALALTTGTGHIEPPAGVWADAIGRAADPTKRAVGGRSPLPASTRYEVVGVRTGLPLPKQARAKPSEGQGPRVALLAIEPLTGRTHQIRVHAAHAGAPLLGDRDYGGPRTLVLPGGKVVLLDRIALHCARVRIADELDIASPVPEALREWWRAAGGNDEAWLAALA